MANKTIILVCLAGMSTNLLMTRMRKAAIDDQNNVDIRTLTINEMKQVTDFSDIDLVLLSPQARFLKQQLETRFLATSMPVEVINMADYGMINGYNIYQTAKSLLEQS